MKQKPLSYLLQGVFSVGLLSAAAAFAGGVQVDPVGTKLTAGTVVSGTICGTAPKCEPAMLSYTDAKGMKQFVLLGSGTLLAANVHTGSTLTAAKVISYQKIENESISGAVLDGVALDEVTLDAVVIKDAKVVGSHSTLQIGYEHHATLKHLSLRDAKVAAGTLQLAPASAAKSADPKPDPKPEPAVAPKYPDINYVGDYFHFRGVTAGFQPLSGDKKDEIQAVPINSCFRVNGDPLAPNDPNTVVGTFVTKDSESPLLLSPKKMILDGCGLKADKVSPSDVNRALSFPEPGISYKVNKSVLENSSRERYGWTYGALVAPIKYYPGQSQFGSNVSIAGYVGYRVHDRQGSSSVFAIGLGPALATVKATDGSSSSVNGASIALAYLAEFKNSYTLGLMLGVDQFSKGDNVPMSGKPYIGINLGVNGK